MNALVTGAAGFVGANLARRLAKDGHEVHALARSSSDLWRLKNIPSNLIIENGDVNDKEALATLLQNIKPDVVFHLATRGAYHTQQDREEILKTTIFGTLNLLHAAKAAGVKILINTGSSSEYGTKDHPMREDERIDPNSFYAVGKATQTLMCQEFARKESFPIITLRLFSVFGPYEEPERLVPSLIRRARANEDLPLASPETARDFIFVDDVVDAYLEAAKHPELSGEVFNIGSSIQHPLKNIVETILSQTNSASVPRWGTYPPRPFDTSIWVADMEKTRRLLGPIGTTPLAEGLKRTIEWRYEVS